MEQGVFYYGIGEDILAATSYGIPDGDLTVNAIATYENCVPVAEVIYGTQNGGQWFFIIMVINTFYNFFLLLSYLKTRLKIKRDFLAHSFCLVTIESISLCSMVSLFTHAEWMNCSVRSRYFIYRNSLHLYIAMFSYICLHLIVHHRWHQLDIDGCNTLIECRLRKSNDTIG